jgi:WD40 repeat protein
LESGAQIGEDWRDEENKKEGVYSMALSPNGKNVFSGTHDGKVKLWDVEMGKVVATWTGHTKGVLSVCWSVDGNQVVSGSWDGTARVRDVKTGEEILEIKTGHQDVWAVIYSPDNKQIATGGYYGGYKDGIKIWNTPIMIGTRGFKLYDLKDKVKIWDAKTGELIVILKHDYMVGSLAWTSDGKRLISASFGPIRIFDTATWQQVGTLEGHAWVHAISLSGNNRFLVSTSDDKTARLWNLDTNLPIGPSFQHEDCVECAAFSADGKVLVTGCRNKNTYMWNIHAILKQAGLEDLLTTDTNIVSANTSHALGH